MNRTRSSQVGIFTPRVLFAFSICSISLLLAVFSLSAIPLHSLKRGNRILDGGAVEGRQPRMLDRALRSAPRILPPNTTNGFEGPFLYGVTCIGTSDCWAVGNTSNAIGSYKTLIEHWDGASWSIASSVNASSTSDNELYGLSCVSAADCWAVGRYFSDTSSRYETLTEHWDGNSWSITSSPNATATLSNGLNAVTCNSASDCWAVGSYGSSPSPQHQTLIEHWDGVSWSIVDSPNTSTTQDNILSDVTCAGASDCWAVGYTTFATRALFEHWDGTSWNIVNSPALNTPSALYGVTCTSDSQCWAVGYFHNGDGNQALTEKWDGTSWTFISSPWSGVGESLNSVKCTSASNCWAVGDDTGNTGITVKHWDGNAWMLVVAQDPGADPEGLYDVVCVSDLDCWAVGLYAPHRKLFEHWDGNAWSIFSMPLSLGGVVSRKVHGTEGTFDISLPQTGPAGIECRFGTPTGDFQMVFTFGSELASVGSVSVNAGSVSGSSIATDPHQFIVDLTGVPNAQYVTVTLNAVQDVDGGTGDASGTMGMLRGDTTGNGVVNSTDLAQTKSRVGQPIDTSTFRSDIQPNGSVNAADISLVKFNMGSALP